MSTVLWSNHLADGVVTADESDKYTLFKHTDKLDAVRRKGGLGSFSQICESTDMRFNVDDIELPKGMESTDGLITRNGVWFEGKSAVETLEEILADMKSNQARFGMLKNDHDEPVAELEESIEFARVAAESGAGFNFSIVM